MNIYQEEILDHYRNPRNRGTVSDATLSATQTNPLCGDQLTISARIADERIADIKFEGEGCAISQAAASMLTEEIAGKSVAEAQAFSDAEMLEALGVELSPARTKCGLLAVSALRKSLHSGTIVSHD